jgi:hypothetical protein
LLANAVGLVGRWRLTECIRQQAGSYSRLHSASETNADGEIGVSREWTRSVLEFIPTRSVGTINIGNGNRGFRLMRRSRRSRLAGERGGSGREMAAD